MVQSVQRIQSGQTVVQAAASQALVIRANQVEIAGGSQQQQQQQQHQPKNKKKSKIPVQTEAEKKAAIDEAKRLDVLVKAMSKVFKQGVDEAMKHIDEDELDENEHPYQHNFTKNNGPLMQVTNAHGLILSVVQGNFTRNCCSNLSVNHFCHNMHGEHELVIVYRMQFVIRDPVLATSDDVVVTNPAHLAPSNETRLKEHGCQMSTVIRKLVKLFQQMAPCEDCGSVFKKCDKTTMKCMGCLMQETLMNKDQQGTCSICQDDSYRLVTLNCNHKVHWKCFKRVKKDFFCRLEGGMCRRCPMCRATVPKLSSIR